MRIIGPDELIFGVDDLEACRTFLMDYGLTEVDRNEDGGSYHALDGTGGSPCAAVAIHPCQKPLPTASMLRKTIYGRRGSGNAGRNRRPSLQGPRGGSRSRRFAVLPRRPRLRARLPRHTRKTLNLPAELINSPGAKPGRGPNVIGGQSGRGSKAAHPVAHRLFRARHGPDDEVLHRPAEIRRHRQSSPTPVRSCARSSNYDHHVLFMIQTPAYMQGLEHLAFHMQGPTELMLAGSRMVKRGYESFWGPGPPQIRVQLVLVLQLATWHPYRV